MKILKKLLWFVAAACVLSGCADDRMIYKPGSGSGNGGNGGGGEQPSGPGDYSKLTAANHPRIIMSEDDVTAIKAKLAAGSDANLKKLHECIMAYADKALTLAKEAGAEILPVVLDGTKTLIKKNLAFNWGNRITVRVLPPVPAERVAALETHELMQEVHERMCTALGEVRNEKLKVKDQK